MPRSPDPAPTLSADSVPTMAVDAGAMTNPIPDPINAKAIPTVKYPEWTVSVVRVIRPPVTSPMPDNMAFRRPNRAVTRAATLLLMRLMTARGKKRRPTPSGSAP